MVVCGPVSRSRLVHDAVARRVPRRDREDVAFPGYARSLRMRSTKGWRQAVTTQVSPIVRLGAPVAGTAPSPLRARSRQLHDFTVERALGGL